MTWGVTNNEKKTKTDKSVIPKHTKIKHEQTNIYVTPFGTVNKIQRSVTNQVPFLSSSLNSNGLVFFLFLFVGNLELS